VHMKFMFESPKVRVPFRSLDVGGRTILKCMLKKLAVRLGTGFMCLRIGTSGELL
jgi:hypothetical protein